MFHLTRLANNFSTGRIVCQRFESLCFWPIVNQTNPLPKPWRSTMKGFTKQFFCINSRRAFFDLTSASRKSLRQSTPLPRLPILARNAEFHYFVVNSFNHFFVEGRKQNRISLLRKEIMLSKNSQENNQ